MWRRITASARQSSSVVRRSSRWPPSFACRQRVATAFRLPWQSRLPSLLAALLLDRRGAAASTGQLELTVVDKDTGKPITCRMHLVGPKKRPFKPEKVPFWHDHFVVPGKILLKLPVGNYTFVIERGLEYLDRNGHFTIEHFADDSKQVELRRFVDMAADGWWSGDLDVRRPARDIELLMAADDLHVAEVITWRNDKNPWGGQLPSSRGALRRQPLLSTAGRRARPDRARNCCC